MLTSFSIPRAPSSGETATMRGLVGATTGGSIIAGGGGGGDSGTPSSIISLNVGEGSLVTGGGSETAGVSMGSDGGSLATVTTPENRSAFSDPQATRQSHAAVAARLRTT